MPPPKSCPPGTVTVTLPGKRVFCRWVLSPTLVLSLRRGRFGPREALGEMPPDGRGRGRSDAAASRGRPGRLAKPQARQTPLSLRGSMALPTPCFWTSSPPAPRETKSRCSKPMVCDTGSHQPWDSTRAPSSHSPPRTSNGKLAPFQ